MTGRKTAAPSASVAAADSEQLDGPFAENFNTSCPDDVVAAGHGHTRVEPGTYTVRYQSHREARPFGAPKVEIEFCITSGDYAGVIVCAYRHVESVGERTAISVPRNGKLMLELRRLAAQRGKHSVSMRLLQGIDLDVQVSDVRTEGTPYSVVERIKGVHGVPLAAKAKDPTGAERTRRWRQRRREKAAVTAPSRNVTDRHTTVTPSQTTVTCDAPDRHATAVTPSEPRTNTSPQPVTPAVAVAVASSIRQWHQAGSIQQPAGGGDNRTDAEIEADEERAAIMEFDGGLSREDAEAEALAGNDRPEATT